MMPLHSPMRRLFFAIFAFMLLTVGLSGHQFRRSGTRRISDWSTRHVIFSSPRTAEQAARAGKDLRYQQQWSRRNASSIVGDASAPDTNVPEADGGWRLPGRGGLGFRGLTWPFRRDWSTSIGSGASMPPNAFPAKFGFDTGSASCNDFVVFTSDLSGGSALSIIAFKNLYAGSSPVGACPGGPTPLFAYETETNGGVTSSSPVISFFDTGTQIAYIEGGGGIGVLHVLRWASDDGGTASAPVAVTTASTTGAGYVSCKATTQSCLLSLAFANGGEDTNSAPFVDYDDDNLYVGDNAGVLHKFSGVFNGTPVEVTMGGWPVTVNESVALTSPVYDSVSNNIYMGDSSGLLSFVKEAPASGVGGCASGSAPCLGNNSIDTQSADGGGITDAPIVDSTNGTVFAFVATDGSTNGDNSAVFQAPTTLASSIEATIGHGAFNFTAENYNPVYSGAFDNNYFNAPSTGFLYVCGNVITGTSANMQSVALFRIGFDGAGAMNATHDANELDLSAPVNFLTTDATACSPGTEIFNPNSNTDLIFFSVQSNSNLANCGGSSTTPGDGCVMSFDITSSFPSSAANSAPEAGGTSGIIIDNTVPATTVPQAASLYFTRLAGSACPSGTTGCAVKLTQSGFN
jgi:hypothetical protein